MKTGIKRNFAISPMFTRNTQIQSLESNRDLAEKPLKPEIERVESYYSQKLNDLQWKCKNLEDYNERKES